MQIYVIRHGETDYNKQGRYAGSSDIPINSEGIKQAAEAAEKLQNIKFDLIISSPLIRARETAEIISKSSGVKIITDNRIRERCVGVFEGLTREEAKEKYPELYLRKCTSVPNDAPDGGETIIDVDKRVSSFLHDLSNQYPEKILLIVCHGFVSRMIYRCVNNLSYEEMISYSLKNCETAQYDISKMMKP